MIFVRGLFLAILCIYSVLGIAKPQTVDIYIVKMRAIKMINENGDHIYFRVNNHFAMGGTRVPTYPMHWESWQLPCVRVKIWSGSVPVGSCEQIVFSMMDQEFPLFEDDRLIGSIKVELVNRGGKVHSYWSMVHGFDEPKVEQLRLNKPQFIMYGQSAQYMVEFKVVTR